MHEVKVTRSSVNLFIASNITLLFSILHCVLSFWREERNHKKDPIRIFLGAETPAWHSRAQERFMSWSPVFCENGALNGVLEVIRDW